MKKVLIAVLVAGAALVVFNYYPTLRAADMVLSSPVWVQLAVFASLLFALLMVALMVRGVSKGTLAWFAVPLELCVFASIVGLAWMGSVPTPDAERVTGVSGFHAELGVENMRLIEQGRYTTVYGGVVNDYRLPEWSTEVCDFDEGKFKSALDSAATSLHYATSDRYGYCDDGAVIVVPLWDYNQEGRKSVEAAVVYFDGEAKVVTDTSDIKGPLYPRSLAQEGLDRLGPPSYSGTATDALELMGTDGTMNYVSVLKDYPSGNVILVVANSRTGEFELQQPTDLPPMDVIESKMGVDEVQLIPADGHWLAIGGGRDAVITDMVIT